MPIIQTKELLHELRSGRWDPASASLLEQASSVAFVANLRDRYPIVFQERRVGRKHEVGLARSLRFELALRKHPGSLFQHPSLLPILRHCVFVSAYEESLAEITVTSCIRVSPGGGASGEVILKTGRGHKLDRTPDGWVLKPIQGRKVSLSEDFLAKRGWQFDALIPFSS